MDTTDELVECLARSRRPSTILTRFHHFHQLNPHILIWAALLFIEQPLHVCNECALLARG
jgi:hypothetical protein